MLSGPKIIVCLFLCKKSDVWFEPLTSQSHVSVAVTWCLCFVTSKRGSTTVNIVGVTPRWPRFSLVSWSLGLVANAS